MTHIPDQGAYDVFVAGAGPVGLFLVCELAMAQCSVLVLEKQRNTGKVSYLTMRPLRSAPECGSFRCFGTKEAA